MRCMVLLVVVGALSASAVELSPIPGDATEVLQKAFDDPANDEVVLGRGDWNVRPLKIRRSGWTLRLKDGARILAAKGAFKGVNDVLLSIKASDFSILGEGDARLEMRLRDYQDRSEYAFSEWRHTLLFWGCTNNVVRGVSCLRAGGDGIEIHETHNLLIEDCKFIDCNRVGGGAVDMDGVTYRRCLFKDTNGTPPKCGVDFEPNFPTEQICNLLMEDCEFVGHQSCGALMHLGAFNQTTKPVSAVFRRCISRGNRMDGFRVNAGNPSGCVKGTIEFIDCQSIDNGGNDLTLNQVSPDGIQFKVVNCNFKKIERIPWVKPENAVPWKPAKLRPLVMTSGTRFTGWYRGGLKFVQLAPKAGTYSVKLRSKSFDDDVPKIKVSVTDALGTPLEVLTFGREAFGPDGYTYTFTTSMDGNCRQFDISASGVLVGVESEWPGALIRADNFVRPYCLDDLREYAVCVPASAEKVTIQLRAEEPVAGVLYNAEGQEVSRVRVASFGKLDFLSATRKPTAKDEVWRFRLTEVAEDAYFSIVDPCPAAAELVPMAK